MVGFAEPEGDVEELLDLIPTDLKEPFDPREVIRLVADGVSADNGVVFDEFKPLYGSSLVTGWARIHGHQVGILANAQGVLFSEEAQKATQFIQLANQVDVPLLFLHNTTGYMVGKEYEQGGIIKHGAQMINAVSNSKVPHISIIMGASYGAGNYGMNGRAFDPRFLFTWPSAKSAVMGPAQLAGVLSIVARAAAEAKGKEYDDAADAGHARVRRGERRGAEPAVLPLRDVVRRRRDRPARHQDDPRHLPLRDHRQPARRGHQPLRSVQDMTAIRRLLVANRGEIARRVFATCRRLGIETVAVHSDADAGLPFVREADAAVRLPGNSPAETYLRADLVLEAARRTGADAIHPGYGFLSENADFARAVIAAGHHLGRPGARVDRADGLEDRVEEADGRGRRTGADQPHRRDGHRDGPARCWSRHRPVAADAGCAIVRTLADLPDRDRRGRGRGRVGLRRRHGLRRAVRRARPPRRGAGARPPRRRAGARRARLLAPAPPPEGGRGGARPRTSPRPPATPCTRRRAAAAAAIDYRGAGTVEFLYDAETERFFFLEMNTRLQVEHPVTEARARRRPRGAAARRRRGRGRLDERRGSARPYGHAIEVRLYAEDPAHDWQPQSGVLTRFEVPGVAGEFDLLNRPGLRLDSGFEAGNEVGDALRRDARQGDRVGSHASEAARKLADALSRARLHGVTTNRDLLVASLRDEAFLEGDVSTDFFERTGHRAATGEQLPPDPHLLFAAAVALAERDRRGAAHPGRHPGRLAQRRVPTPAHGLRRRPTRSTSSSGTAAATATPRETVDVRVVSAAPGRA